MTTERWRDIPGFEGRYQVSDKGRVRAVPFRVRYVHFTGRECFRMTKEHILSTQLINSGYLIVHLQIDYQRTARTVHSLVAEAFVEGCFPGADVNHKDGVKTNNTAGNLEWITRTENHLHAVRLGLNKQAIRVVDPLTGVRYDSIAQAARGARLSHRTVRATFDRTTR